MANYIIYGIYFVALEYLLLGKNEIRKQRLDTNKMILIIKILSKFRFLPLTFAFRVKISYFLLLAIIKPV